MPVGTLISEGIMPVINKDPNLNNDAESVDAFFLSEYVRYLLCLDHYMQGCLNYRLI